MRKPFEDLPASDRRPDDVYLDEVVRCGVYVGLFGNEYGPESAEGISATEREFDRATAKGKVRLFFVNGADDEGRRPKMAALVRKAGGQLIRRRFTSVAELTGANRQTALLDLRELISHGIVVQMVATGRGAYYRLRRKRDTNRTNATS